jgi:choline-sulfatase
MRPQLTRRSALAAAAGPLLGGRRRALRPNLLFLIGDDHRYDVLGAAGNPLAETPHLDRLAREGTRFAHHYVNYPMCTPSRQSVLTGLLPHACGVPLLRSVLADETLTLAEQLRAEGYHTAAFGKMHFNRPPSPGIHGFDVALVDGAVQKAWRDKVRPRPVEAGMRTKPPWRPFRDPARIWLNADKLPYPRYEADMLGTYIARQACDFLRTSRRPLAAWVSFFEPHSPFDFPIEYRDRFDPARFPVPAVGPEDGPQIPLIFRELSDADKRGIIAAYYTSVAFLDRNVGRVLEALREAGLEENTLVVYWGDNGYSLGEHGRFEKHCFYEPAIRVPLLVRFPGHVPAGRVIEQLTESVDIAPTILELLGARPLPRMHGRSLAGFFGKDSPAPGRDHIFSEYLHNEEVAIRTRQWKLIYCSGRRRRDDGYETDHPTPGRYTRLFDLEADPGEFTDLSARRPELVRELLDLALRRFRETHPEAGHEPAALTAEEALDWYLRPREAW